MVRGLGLQEALNHARYNRGSSSGAQKPGKAFEEPAEYNTHPNKTPPETSTFKVLQSRLQNDNCNDGQSIGYGTGEYLRTFNESTRSRGYPNDTIPGMRVLDIWQSRLPNDSSNAQSAAQNLSCLNCSKTFKTLSEYNKHEKQHSKPYECLIEDCNESFSQKQQLDRHSQSRHGKMTKYYHCTTEGCKYSCTNKRAKKVLREDHIKAHIKQVGHYGPHSPYERQSQAKQATLCNKVKILFEEWKVGDIPENSRTFRTAELGSSSKAPLLYPDIVDESYLIQKNCDLNGFHCDQPGCHFNQGIGEERSLAFKLQSDLIAHKRRTLHQSCSQNARTSQYPCNKPFDPDPAASDIPSSQVQNASETAQNLEVGPPLHRTNANEGFSKFPGPWSNTRDPLTLEKASVEGIDHVLSTGIDVRWPWLLESGYSAQDNESTCTATQPRYESYPEPFQPNATSTFDFDADEILASTGTWNSPENETTIRMLPSLNRRLTIDTNSDFSTLSTSSSVLFSEAGSFSTPGEFFSEPRFMPRAPTKSGTWVSSDWGSSSLLSSEDENPRLPENEHKAITVSPMSYLQSNVSTSTMRTPCPECNKDFGRNRDMMRHLNSCHKAAVFKCPYKGCGREYSRADKLNSHRTTHNVSSVIRAEDGSPERPADERHKKEKK